MFASRTFFGTGSGVLKPLPGGVVSDITINPATATATLMFLPDGSVTCNSQADFITSRPQWYDPVSAGIGAGYWIRATATGDALDSGSLGTWDRLDTMQSWRLSTSTPDLKSTSLAISIATDSAGTNIVTSGTYVLQVESSA